MRADAALDLHIHSALSPCASGDMLPPQVLLTAELQGVGTVGIVDHSTARNAPAFVEAALAFGVEVLPGLEAESTEGVHLLALFATPEAALQMDGAVARHLPDLPNRPDIFGEQLLVNEWGDLTDHDPRLLVTAVDLSLDELVALTHDLGGIAVPAHVDRSANGLLPTLGFIPPGLEADLFEVSFRTTREHARSRWPQLATLPVIGGSDAHSLGEIGRACTTIPRELARPAEPLREWARALSAYLLRET
jgi:PHP family Zn ribbon phosphoesterase